MTPQSPVVKGLEKLEIVYAKDHPQYLQLPALPVDDGSGHKRVVTRWRLSWVERLRILIFGDMYLWVSTFGKPICPVALQVTPPEFIEGGAQ